MSLPEGLLTAVREGRAVLMLGAGASYGALNAKGEKIPLGEGIAAELTKNYLSDEYAGLDFRTTYDLACSVRDTRTVQQYLHDRLIEFKPSSHHLLLPTFHWAGLLTTNYDLIVEKSYQIQKSTALQKLVPHLKDADRATSLLTDDDLLYIKMHGCITLYDEIDPPMLASTEQLISYETGRVGQFRTFLEWSRNKTIIFVGYGFADTNIRQLLDAIIREGDNRPRHYLVDPKILPAMDEYWRERRILALKMSFSDFMGHLDQAISPTVRTLAAVNAAIATNTSFTKFISVSGRGESQELVRYLTSAPIHITADYEAKHDDPKRFYKGFDLGWYPFQAELDVVRTLGDDILSDHVIAERQHDNVNIIVLKGHAGAGKTTTMRRMCWDAARTYDKLCLFVNREVVLDTDAIIEIISLTNLKLFLFIDGVSNFRNEILDLIRKSQEHKNRITIIGSEAYSAWNTYCERLEPYVGQEYNMKSLSPKDIDSLLRKLEQYKSLGALEDLDRDKRREAFTVSYNRQILVALLEVTHGLPLAEIISDEYKSIEPLAARQIYLDVCSLHRFGPPVRAGLISRLHDITFEDFERQFFRPLEQVVKLGKDTKSGDFVYQARHPYIALTLYENIVRTEEERFENISRIIGKMNPSYQYDMEALTKVIRAENIISSIKDRNRARQIYDLTIESVGRVSFVLQQRGVYEMRVASNMTELRYASEWLYEAEGLAPRNRSIKHSLAELDLKRSWIAEDRLERVSWRRTAVSQASALTLGGSSPYPHHTIMKAAIADVEEALADSEAEASETNIRALSTAISDAEESLKRGLKAFPNDPLLLQSEGNLANVLSLSDRAEDAFKQAFKANPRSTVVARRLVRIYNSKGKYPQSIAIIRDALEATPSDQALHYEMALAILKSSPTADRERGEAITHHLRRAFTFGDKNYRAQFWYARQLCLTGSSADAKDIYRYLESVRLPFNQRITIRGIVKDDETKDHIFSGQVLVYRSSYGIVNVTSPAITAFVPSENFQQSEKIYFSGSPVSFKLGFNYKGPVAIDVRHTSES